MRGSKIGVLEFLECDRLCDPVTSKLEESREDVDEDENVGRELRLEAAMEDIVKERREASKERTLDTLADVVLRAGIMTLVFAEIVSKPEATCRPLCDTIVKFTQQVLSLQSDVRVICNLHECLQL